MVLDFYKNFTDVQGSSYSQATLKLTTAVADPGFPVGGVDLVGAAWIPEVVTIRKFCMSKQRNLDHWGGGCAGVAFRLSLFFILPCRVVSSWLSIPFCTMGCAAWQN